MIDDVFRKRVKSYANMIVTFFHRKQTENYVFANKLYFFYSLVLLSLFLWKIYLAWHINFQKRILPSILKYFDRGIDICCVFLCLPQKIRKLKLNEVPQENHKTILSVKISNPK